MTIKSVNSSGKSWSCYAVATWWLEKQLSLAVAVVAIANTYWSYSKFLTTCRFYSFLCTLLCPTVNPLFLFVDLLLLFICCFCLFVWHYLPFCPNINPATTFLLLGASCSIASSPLTCSCSWGVYSQSAQLLIWMVCIHKTWLFNSHKPGQLPRSFGNTSAESNKWDMQSKTDCIICMKP